VSEPTLLSSNLRQSGFGYPLMSPRPCEMVLAKMMDAWIKPAHDVYCLTILRYCALLRTEMAR
jgi:hypothetical protein